MDLDLAKPSTADHPTAPGRAGEKSAATVVGLLLLVTLVQVWIVNSIFFPRQPAWSLGLSILSLGIGTPLLYMLARAAVYEADIGAGQFFLLARLLAAWFAMSGPRLRVGLLGAAGMCWALSAGSRDSLRVDQQFLTHNLRLYHALREFFPHIAL